MKLKIIILTMMYSTILIANSDANKFHIAVKNCKLETVKSLLKKGIDVDILNEYDDNVLYGLFYFRNSIQNKTQCKQVIDVLVENGINLEYKKNKLIDAIRGTDDFEVYMIEILLAQGIVFKGTSILHWASAHGELSIAKLALVNGNSVNKIDKAGWTPLHVASDYGEIKLASFLISHGAKIDKLGKNLHGNTPMNRAFLNSKYKMVKFLFDKGANINLVDKRSEKTILDWCFYDGRGNYKESMELLYYILKRSKTITKNTLNKALIKALNDARNLEIVKVLIERGADVNYKTTYGSTSLHILANKEIRGERDREYIKIIEFIIKKGAFVDVRDKNNITPLLEAVRVGNLYMAWVLLQGNANVNAVVDGETALHLILKSIFFNQKKYNIAKVLLGFGADVHVKNKYGETPLSLAKGEIKKLLLENDTHKESKNK